MSVLNSFWVGIIRWETLMTSPSLCPAKNESAGLPLAINFPMNWFGIKYWTTILFKCSRPLWFQPLWNSSTLVQKLFWFNAITILVISDHFSTLAKNKTILVISMNWYLCISILYFSPWNQTVMKNNDPTKYISIFRFRKFRQMIQTILISDTIFFCLQFSCKLQSF